MGDEPQSLEQFRKSVAANPDQRSARVELARLLVEHALYVEARAVADSEIAVGNRDPALRDVVHATDSLSRR
jgi:Tfp pilus assembly protein PilF